jgi:hypothetical protein
MMPILLMAAAASAGPPYVGLPLDAVPGLGLGEPTLSRALDEVRISLPQGGVAVVEIAPTDDEADVWFERRLRTAATRWPAATAPLPFDRAVGDGAAVLLVRQRNAVVYVRDLGNDATDVATAILAALTTDPARCAPVSRTDPDGTSWSACGLRTSAR